MLLFLLFAVDFFGSAVGKQNASGFIWNLLKKTAIPLILRFLTSCYKRKLYTSPATLFFSFYNCYLKFSTAVNLMMPNWWYTLYIKHTHLKRKTPTILRKVIC